MSGFEELKRSLRSAQGVCSISDAQGHGKTYVCPLDVSSRSLTDILAPFLSVIRSPLSTGPITSAALSALHSFFSCGFFLKNDPSVDVALAAVSSSVSHCKFEASDSSGDEVVLLRILTVIEDCMCGGWGTRLGDIEVCEMLETVLATCVQMRLSGLSFRIVPRCDCSHYNRGSATLGRADDAQTRENGPIQTSHPRSCERGEKAIGCSECAGSRSRPLYTNTGRRTGIRRPCSYKSTTEPRFREPPRYFQGTEVRL